MRVALITPDRYTDDFVVDCARVSYHKRASQFRPEANLKLLKYLANPPEGVPHWAPFAGPRIGFKVSMPNEAWLYFFTYANLAGFSWNFVGTSGGYYQNLDYDLNGSLWAWKENFRFLDPKVWTSVQALLLKQFPASWGEVFNLGNLGEVNETLVGPMKFSDPKTIYENLRIKAPIFVARQLGKHQVGLVWNEVSRRYVRNRPELYWPEVWHKSPQHSKQGASTEQYVMTRTLAGAISSVTDGVYAYEELIEDDLAPEEARMLLPQNMMTEWIWTGSLAAFSRVCRERLAPSAQGATREVAAMISDCLAEKHGCSWRY